MVGMALLAPRIIDLLYGSAFAPSQVSLIILSFDIPLLLLTAFCGNITAATGLEGPAARIYISSVLMNVVLNLIFIPKYGMLAASAVSYTHLAAYHRYFSWLRAFVAIVNRRVEF